ncbi:CMP-N-acetylneuraminic acid synthetase [Hydrogenimonas thermophila]|uniref:CMP-N-acetylneuraminic acid synthetase n=1 Tax=Hydrogenimonas thermophila TaxID=223786 RepID=A0A1I5U3N1_9BACT|nr:CMP-N-acetylneuraminic acid synthetase [Hydrogenimonas thermophila]
MSNVLIIIPARGGSKGIPRKNLRNLAGKPLIKYSIDTALNSKYRPDVVVSSDDDEILSITKKSGAIPFKRDKDNATDKSTLDPVIYEVYTAMKDKSKKNYDIVVTMQPTSPLLKTSTLDRAIEKILTSQTIDTIISAIDDTHLTWKKVDGKYLPNYEKRLNRQYLTPIYKETGGFLITKSKFISPNNRIGKSVDLFLLESSEAIDIDTYEDWNICEFYLKRKKILFVVSGYPEIGLGHVYNTLIVANDILNHDLKFLVDNKSQLAYDIVNSKNYPVYIQKYDNIIDDILELSPDVIINDCLDTDSTYIKSLKQHNISVINFEDLGSGAEYADLVINAIYPEKMILPNHYYGPDYVLLRDEFILSAKHKVTESVTNVLVAFGGVDPNNYTYKVIKSIYDYCIDKEITIHVVTGFGYDKYESLKPFDRVKIHKNVKNISDYMVMANIAFISAGRTVFEIASIGTPSIVLAQNERELKHFFASESNGFLNLGLGTQVSNQDILSHFKILVESTSTRQYMQNLMHKHDLIGGRKRVNLLINQFLEKL